MVKGVCSFLRWRRTFLFFGESPELDEGKNLTVYGAQG